VFRGPEEFANYWRDNFGDAAMPKGIDWHDSELVAIHLGHRGSLGYDVRIVSVTRIGDDTLVKWVERLPIVNGVPRARPCSPFVIASFERQRGKVRFEGGVEDPRKPFASTDAFPKETFLSGGHSLMANEYTTVISDGKGMAEVWTNAFGRGTPPPACDFRRWRLVAIFLGQRPTPGYEPVIDRIARVGPHEVQIRYSETKPDPGAILPQLVTNPFVILKVPVNSDEITVEKA
jgi:hypothetical protein